MTSHSIKRTMPAGKIPAGVVRTLKPGDKGTQRFVKEYGDRLVAVRYRKAGNGNLLTTVELTMDMKPARQQGIRYDAIDAQRREQRVALNIRYEESALRGRVKQAGCWWDKTNKVWRLRYDDVVALGLIDRVVSSPDVVSKSGHQDQSDVYI